MEDSTLEPGRGYAASAGGHTSHEPTYAASVPARSPHDVMGHGGHGGATMAEMVADMRRRFVVAAVLSVPIILWSPIGRDVLGFDVAAPFGLREDVFMLLLSLPVIFWSAWTFRSGSPSFSPVKR